MKKRTASVFTLLIILFSSELCFSQDLYPEYEEKRKELINSIEKNQGIRDRKLLYSIELIDRELFIPDKFKKYSYSMTSIPLSNGKTIPPVSEIVKILNLADTKEKQKILIIGNNAGYAAALFSYFYDSVYLVETDTTLLNLYKTILEDKYNNITVYYGSAPDAFQGYGPFDAVFIHGSVGRVDPVYFDILKSLGEIIFPLESPDGLQQIVKYRKVYSEISITAGEVSSFPPLK